MTKLTELPAHALTADNVATARMPREICREPREIAAWQLAKATAQGQADARRALASATLTPDQAEVIETLAAERDLDVAVAAAGTDPLVAGAVAPVVDELDAAVARAKAAMLAEFGALEHRERIWSGHTFRWAIHSWYDNLTDAERDAYEARELARYEGSMTADEFAPPAEALPFTPENSPLDDACYCGAALTTCATHLDAEPICTDDGCLNHACLDCVSAQLTDAQKRLLRSRQVLIVNPAEAEATMAAIREEAAAGVPEARAELLAMRAEQPAYYSHRVHGYTYDGITAYPTATAAVEARDGKAA